MQIQISPWRSIVPLLCLLVGLGAGHLLTRSYSVESTLQQARAECVRELYGNADFKQWHLNLCSSFLRRLAEMELAWRSLEVTSAENYYEFEKDYLRWSCEWARKLEADRDTPSEFEGGSMAMMDAALRQYGLLCGQLEELEVKWESRIP